MSERHLHRKKNKNAKEENLIPVRRICFRIFSKNLDFKRKYIVVLTLFLFPFLVDPLPKNLGLSATVSLESSPVRKLQTQSLITIPNQGPEGGKAK